MSLLVLCIRAAQPYLTDFMLKPELGIRFLIVFDCGRSENFQSKSKPSNSPLEPNDVALFVLALFLHIDTPHVLA